MHPGRRNVKTLLVTVAVAALVLVGAGVAYANGSGSGSSGQAAGANLDKAKSVALEHVNGRVTETEVGDEEGYYQIEVTHDDGSQVDVNLDRNFNVLGTSEDGENPDGKDSPSDKGG
jgi:hypothetical protein